MPGESGIVHGCWQPVPGEPEARLWPFLRKIDTVSSNSYIIASGNAVFVIDPGGLLPQAEELSTVIRALPGGGERPVLTILTHAHIDHCKALMDSPFFHDPASALAIVQEDGANALATADARHTQAALLGQEVVPVRAAVRLFSGLGTGPCSEASVPYGNGTALLSTAFRPGPDGSLRAGQTLQAGGSCPVRLYHTPGHSPDSICIRIGSLLFIGDILFAASPGIAGMYGWDRQALVRSIEDVLALLQDGGITHCCPGHGKVLTRAEAERVLAGVKRDAEKLDGIAELSPAWAKDTALYAEGLMDEAGEIFTIIAARLLFVSHVLDELEEEGEAGAVAGLIDADRIDALLADFQEFLAGYRAGGKMDVHLALKAGQIVGKLEQVFSQEQLALVLDPAYLRRLQRLLNDYITVLRGFRPPRMLQPVAIGKVLPAFIGQLKQGGTSVQDMMDAADDSAAFTRALVRRIARVTAFDAVTCEVPPAAAGLEAEIDCTLFTDLIRTFLEDIAGSGGTGIAVRLIAGDRQLSVAIELPVTGRMPVFREVRRRFLAGECERSGGRLSCREGADPPSVRIDVPLLTSRTDNAGTG